MQKTLITLLALAGVAGATGTITTSYEPLKEAGIWDLTRGRTGGSSTDNNSAKQNATTGEIYTNDPYWKQPYATLSFTNAITLRDKADSLSFSFTLTTDTRGQYNSMLTVALEGKAGVKAATIMMGYGHNYSADYNTNFKSAVVANNSSDAYLFNTTWGDTKTGFTQYNCTNADVLGTLTTSTTFSGEIVWNNSESAYVLTLKQGGVSAEYTLGSSYEMTGISIAMDGDSGNDRKDYPGVSKLSITSITVPEPTAATLSLLALAGLAARRRRK